MVKSKQSTHILTHERLLKCATDTKIFGIANSKKRERDEKTDRELNISDSLRIKQQLL